jgi:hypothetical protein
LALDGIGESAVDSFAVRLREREKRCGPKGDIGASRERR